MLAEANINIASMAVARQVCAEAGGMGGEAVLLRHMLSPPPQFPGSPALSVLLCDSRIPAAVLRQINGLEGINNARAATLQVSAPAADDSSAPLEPATAGGVAATL